MTQTYQAGMSIPAQRAPETPARADVLPAVCPTCRNTRKVADTVVRSGNGLVLSWPAQQDRPCPTCR